MSASLVIVSLPSLTVPPRVQTILGKQPSVSNDIEEFRGIPYGMVPGRWKHSQIRTSLPRDTFEAFDNGPKCPQLSEGNNSEGFQAYLPFPSDVAESEFDCLNLFVIRPSIEALKRRSIDTSVAPLPVLVWIHGGGYGFGAATDPMWNPTNLVLQSIKLGTPCIAVSLNYRLSVFGFGATTQMLYEQLPESVQGCNFGLRDQKVALTWISKNIRAFGGDPKKISIAGQSAGGCSVYIHAVEAKLRPETPLFRNAVIQSGAVGCLGPISIDQADERWETLSKHAGITTKDPVARLTELREKSPSELMLACKTLGWTALPLVNDKRTLAFTDKLEPLLVDLGTIYNNTVQTSQHEPIAIMLGEVDCEVLYPFISYPHHGRADAKEMMLIFVQGSLWYDEVSSIRSYEDLRTRFETAFPTIAAAEHALRTYGITPGISHDDMHPRLTKFLTDVQFSYPISRAGKFLIERHTGLRSDIVAPTNVPMVFHDTPVEFYKMKFGNPFPGRFFGIAHHCVELIYILDAFHNDLNHADKAVEEVSSTVATPDSGYQSANDLYTLVRRSNSDLRKQLQRQWIDFIVKDHSASSKVSSKTAGDGNVFVYGADRIARLVSRNEDVSFKEQNIRFTFLEAHLAEVRAVAKTFIGV